MMITPYYVDILEWLQGAIWFYTQDITAMQWQIPLKEEHKPYPAFQTSSEHF